MKHVNIVNKRFGRLVVLKEMQIQTKKRKKYFVECVCDCGNITMAEKSKVVGGYTKSCGCLREETRKKLGNRTKKENGEANFNEIFSSYKKGASNRGYSFELTKEEFKKTIVQPCIYCGEEPRIHFHKRSTNGVFKYTGIDRIDNSKGYTTENTVPCCSTCNRIKGNMSVEELEEKIIKMLENKKKWKRIAQEGNK